MVRRERRRKQLLYGQKEMRGCYKLKQRTLDRILWRILFWKIPSTCHKTEFAEPGWVGSRPMPEAGVILSQFYGVTAAAIGSASGPYMSKEHR